MLTSRSTAVNMRKGKERRVTIFLIVQNPQLCTDKNIFNLSNATNPLKSSFKARKNFCL